MVNTTFLSMWRIIEKKKDKALFHVASISTLRTEKVRGVEITGEQISINYKPI